MAEITRKELVLALIGAAEYPRLAGVDLSNAILHGANLQGANLQNATITGVKFDEKTVWPDGKMGTKGDPLSYTK